MTPGPIVPGRATLSTEEAARLLGCDRHTLWRAARRGDAPVTPIKVGRALRWPTASLLRLLELPDDALDRP